MTTAAIKEHPMLFSAPMVRAILAGTKMQTRRIVKAPKNSALIYDLESASVDGPNALDSGQYLHVPFRHRDEPDEGCRERLHAPWDVGDGLWVKETFQIAPVGKFCPQQVKTPDKLPEGWTILYRASGDEVIKPIHWKPSIFMPRWASRITSEITGVRVERLQDISDRDVAAEGCSWNEPFGTATGMGNSPAQRAYYRLWESIHGKNSWSSNPWVWVIKFKKI